MSKKQVQEAINELLGESSEQVLENVYAYLQAANESDAAALIAQKILHEDASLFRRLAK